MENYQYLMIIKESNLLFQFQFNETILLYNLIFMYQEN